MEVFFALFSHINTKKISSRSYKTAAQLPTMKGNDVGDWRILVFC